MATVGSIFTGLKNRVRLLTSTRMLEETCTRKTAESNWVSESTFACHPDYGLENYASSGLDHEEFSTYHVDIYMDVDQPIELADTITCSFGELSITAIGPSSSYGAHKVVTGRKR